MLAWRLMARVYSFLVPLFVLAATLVAADGRERLNLDGTWEFRTDPQSVGVREEWHSPGVSFPNRLQVPGSWQAQGIGTEDGILRHNYSGPAWYRREVNIPASWEGKTIHVRIGGALRQTTLYVNGRSAGQHDGFSTPFSFDITAAVKYGTKNTLAFRIVNPAGDLHDSPDAQVSSQPTGMMNYIGSWGGIYGDVELEATPPTWIDQVAIVPDIARQRASFNVSLEGKELMDTSILVSVAAYQAASSPKRSTDGPAQLWLPMPGMQLWSPDSPHLYQAIIRLMRNGVEVDRAEKRFGMREIATHGQTLVLNGKPLYLRGYGDDNVEVLSGVAPSKEEILRRINLARSFGFNAVRFHSMIPSSKYFEAADEAGLLVMAELPASYTMHFLPHREYLKAELQSVLTLYRNHPSFLSLAFGNEFNLGWLKTAAEKEAFQSTVTDFYNLAKQIDPKRIIMSNDGLLLRPSDMFSLYSGAPADGPTVRHEFGEYYCSLPDPGLIDQFTGVMRPLWLESKKRWIDENDLQNDYPIFLRNSQRLQQLGRKYQIERVRRSPDVTGYHYWLITDYPGGTGEGDSWEEGWFDYFWRPKNISPREGQEINSAVLLLIDSGVEKRTIWSDEPHTIQLTLSNYGDDEIRNATIHWELVSAQATVTQGEARGVNAALGTVSAAGEIQLPELKLSEAQKLQLVAELSAGGKTYQNHWDFWSFPHHQLLRKPSLDVFSTLRWRAFTDAYPFLKAGKIPSSPDALLITPTLSRDALKFLENGGRVWLMADEQEFRRAGDATFFPASGGALGAQILDHPALRGFPHDGTMDLQFFNPMQGGWNFSLDNWPHALKPIVGSIRTTSSFLSKSKKLSKTGYVFEVRVGKGKLLVTTLHTREHYDDAYPETVFLVDKLLRYVSGNEFKPQIAAAENEIQKLLVDD